MGSKSELSKDRSRTFRRALFFFPDDTSQIEVNVSDEHEHLLKLMAGHELKPCRVTINLREYKGVKFVDLLEYAPVTGAVTK